jgi:hypothetical protein
LTCLDGDNQWFWGGHLANIGCAGSDSWSSKTTHNQLNSPRSVHSMYGWPGEVSLFCV